MENAEAIEPTHAASFMLRALGDLASMRIRPRRERVPLRDFARTIGAPDFARLIAAEGLSLNLLTTSREREGIAGVYYTPTFTIPPRVA
jgi:hypothetical protein